MKHNVGEGIMQQSRKIPIVQLNEFLTCKLCKGYYVDATTIIECLHTFCRSCIVQYLQKNKYCPVCDVQVHKSKPLLNIRPDKIIQDIVYKLVPRLFQGEMCKRREFYSVHPEAKPSNLEQCGEASYQHILNIDEMICLALSYCGSSASPRYLRCPGGLTIVHLRKLIRSKYGLPDHYKVDIFYNQDCLGSNLSLIDIAYIYLWKRKGPLELSYQIYEAITNLAVDASHTTDSVLPETDDSKTVPSTLVVDQSDTDGSWKEVQLRISETGEMCFTNIDSTTILNQEVTKSNKDSSESLSNNGELTNSPKVIKEEPPEGHLKEESTNSPIVMKEESPEDHLKGESTNASDSVPEPIEESMNSSTNLDCDNKPGSNSIIDNSTKSSVSEESTECTSAPQLKPKDNIKHTEIFNGKHKMTRNIEEEPAAKQAKPTILNHTLNLTVNHLSINHPLKRNSQTRKSIEIFPLDVPTENLSKPSTVSSVNLVNSSSSSRQSKPTIINKEMNSIASTSGRSIPPGSHIQQKKSGKLPCYAPKVASNPVINVPKVQNTSGILKSKVPITTIVNHKMTIKSKPTTSIGYKTLREPPKTWNPQLPRSLLLKGADKDSDEKNVKPAKFFKMRNNMPRYLGNPASGVKPLYQVRNNVENDGKQVAAKTDKMEIKKHSIVKIDPKTLKPISEKAPEDTSLSSQSEIKINTSSVPIFSPLKLQSSPKRSPKSPQSPKAKSSPTSKREKLNLTCIPPNPFVPNLASPTLSPNQFLYPPGFPTYDQRLVAAYHNLLFGQRFGFPGTHPIPNLNYDLLNQRKGFEVPASTSPLPPLQFFKDKEVPTETSCNAQTSDSPVQDANSIKTKKKQSKELPKNEKSLENTVEKLTQNRVNQLKKVEENKHKNGIDNKDISENSKCNSDSNIDVPSSNCMNTDKSCNKSKTELETQSDIQLLQNGDKTVSNTNNNNTIESVSFENVDNV